MLKSIQQYAADKSILLYLYTILYMSNREIDYARPNIVQIIDF